MAADLSAIQPAGGPQSTVETIAGALRARIDSGRDPPGGRLIEADLTRDLKVSRGALREAFRRLAAEGLIELQLHRGARVRRLSRRETLAMHAVREALEGLAARLAAERVRDGQIVPAPLRDLVIEMDRLLARGDVGEYVDCNRKFHGLLIAWADNDLLAGLARQLQIPIFRIQFRGIADARRLAAGQQDHRAIADAVAAGDPVAAEAAIRRHIQRSGMSLRELGDYQFEPG